MMNAHPTIQDARAKPCSLRGETALPEEIAEAASLLGRLACRAKMDPLMCRAARHLQRDPALSIARLSSQLGVSEAYLSRCLRAVLTADPYRLARIAHNTKLRAATETLMQE
jgi:AraC-like DNA-binding protein